MSDYKYTRQFSIRPAMWVKTDDNSYFPDYFGELWVLVCRVSRQKEDDIKSFQYLTVVSKPFVLPITKKELKNAQISINQKICSESGGVNWRSIHELSVTIEV